MLTMTDAFAKIEPAASPPNGDADSPARVLVVDDDEANRDSLSRRLQRRGYAVITAPDGMTALRAVEAEDFDVVLLDVMMPGISGLEVLKTIRKTHSPGELPVIMATARDTSDALVEAMELGASDYVTKPLDFAAVLARVRTQVSLGRSVRQVIRLERELSRRNADLERANESLRQYAEKTRHDLLLAAKVQATFLPHKLNYADRLRIAWRFLPCDELAGDSLNVFQLDEDHVGLYVLDVSGHGVAASLTAVAASRLLTPGHDPNSILVRPASDSGPPQIIPPSEVLRELSVRFEWNPDITQFVTMFYGVLHLSTRRFTFASAGHPSALRVSNTRVTELESTGLPIGLNTQEAYEQGEVELEPGDRLFIYSDGVIEAMPPNGDQFGIERLAAFLSHQANADLAGTISRLLDDLAAWRGGGPAKDDISVLAAEIS